MNPKKFEQMTAGWPNTDLTREQWEFLDKWMNDPEFMKEAKQRMTERLQQALGLVQWL